MSAPKGAAGVITALLAQAGLDLPVRLRAWDGSEAGALDSPVLVVRSPRALQRILWRPRSESTRLNSSHLARSRMPSSA